MSEPVSDPKAAGSTNRLGPAPKTSRRSTAKGDVPESLLDRYLIERDRQGRAEGFFRDHRSERPLFRDRGGSLVSDQAYPDAVVDMLKIARHRGWNRIRVSGDAAFRREVWIQAQSLGLEVAGHRPLDRDRQAAGHPRLDPSSSRSDLHDRLARASVVVRRLVADPAAQARLIAGALERAGRAERDRSQSRDRQR